MDGTVRAAVDEVLEPDEVIPAGDPIGASDRIDPDAVEVPAYVDALAWVLDDWIRIPVIDMVEIGAGGGSIARLDALGRITVGPDSAGAVPGPACYGRGGEEPRGPICVRACGGVTQTHSAARRRTCPAR